MNKYNALSSLSIIIFLLVVKSALAEWTKVAEYDSVTNYINMSAINKKGRFVILWSLMDFDKRQNNGAHSHITQEEFDCKEEKFRFRNAATFRERMGMGGLIERSSELDVWRSLDNYDVGRNIFNFVCIDHSWVKISGDDFSAHYFDFENIQRKEEVSKFWELMDLNERNLTTGVFSFKVRRELDCKKRLFRNLKIYWHSEAMALGYVMTASDSASNWRPISDHLNEIVLINICG